LIHQFGRNFVPYIYVPVNTFHHINSKVLACDVPPFLLKIPFGHSRFVPEIGYPYGKDDWGNYPSGVDPKGWSQLLFLIGIPAT
jgi:hypothetical protein